MLQDSGLMIMTNEVVLHVLTGVNAQNMQTSKLWQPLNREPRDDALFGDMRGRELSIKQGLLSSRGFEA